MQHCVRMEVCANKFMVSQVCKLFALTYMLLIYSFFARTLDILVIPEENQNKKNIM